MQLQERLEKLHNNVIGWFSLLYHVPHENRPHDVIKLLPSNLNIFPPHEITFILREIIFGMVEWGSRQNTLSGGVLINLLHESEEVLNQTKPPEA